MKTTIKLFTLTAMITLFFTVITSMAQIDLTSDNEAYVNDIPFNTEAIAHEVIFDKTIGFVDDEAYIDDIPFDTHAIASDICCDRELKEKYSYEDESYIDDIPFNTTEIYQQLLESSKNGSLLQSNTDRYSTTQEAVKTNS